MNLGTTSSATNSAGVFTTEARLTWHLAVKPHGPGASKEPRFFQAGLGLLSSSPNLSLAALTASTPNKHTAHCFESGPRQARMGSSLLVMPWQGGQRIFKPHLEAADAAPHHGTHTTVMMAGDDHLQPKYVDLRLRRCQCHCRPVLWH